MAAAIRDVWVNSTPAATLNISVNGAGILGSGGVQANDYLIYGVVSDSQFNSPTFPSGFGTSTTQANSADAQLVACAQKLATGSETTLAATGGGDNIIGFVIAVSGCDTTTPLDVTILVTNSNTASASPREITSGTFTPATNGALIVTITATDTTVSTNSTTTVSTASGTTGSWTNNSSADLNNGFRNIAAGWATQTTAGAVTIKSSSTFASGNAGISQFLIAVRPAASGDTPVTLSDSGAGTDTISISVSDTASDAGAGTDSTTTAAAVSPADTSAGSDAAAVLADAGLSDSAAGSDSAAEDVAIAASDSATGNDSVTVDTGGTPVAVSDSAAGTDSVVLAAGVVGPDTAASSDTATIASSIAGADTGAGTDTAAPGVDLSPTDSSAGSDQAALNAAAGISDSGAGSESSTADAAIAVNDTAAGSDGIVIDTGSPDKDLALSDTAVGSDSIEVQTLGLVLGGRIERQRLPKALRDAARGSDRIIVQRFQAARVRVPAAQAPAARTLADRARGSSAIRVEFKMIEAPKLMRSTPQLLRSQQPPTEAEQMLARIGWLEEQVRRLSATK